MALWGCGWKERMINASSFPDWKHGHKKKRPEEKESLRVALGVCGVRKGGYLQLSQGVVTLLLSCCLLGTERDQLVNTLCHGPETHKATRLSSSCSHSLASLTHDASSSIQARNCRPLEWNRPTRECRDWVEFVFSFVEHRQALADASIFLIRPREVSQARSPAGPAVGFSLHTLTSVAKRRQLGRDVQIQQVGFMWNASIQNCSQLDNRFNLAQFASKHWEKTMLDMYQVLSASDPTLLPQLEDS